MYSVVEQNLRAAMRCYADLGNGSEARDYPGVTVASSDSTWQCSTRRCSPNTRTNLELPIETVDVHFRARGLGWTFWVCDDLLAPELREWRVRNVFRSKGMLRIAEAPGMYAESLCRVRAASSYDICRVCTTERARLEFAHIASIVFSLPFGTSKRIYGSTGIVAAAFVRLGRVFRRKASFDRHDCNRERCYRRILTGNIAAASGGWFGETLLRQAIGEARRETGISRTVLQAHMQGFNLYLRIGYRVVTSSAIYIRESCASF